MGDVAIRELRNDTSGVLRRVEAGERIRLTVSGRAVAEIVPLARRPRYVRWEELWGGPLDVAADPAAAGELRDLLPGTTDDLPSE
jgi:prevent-host-death family protein